MSKDRFREMNVRSSARKALVEFVLKTIQEHEDQGIDRVTSRQLYYRLVAANAIPNTEKSYKATSALLADMRYWGLVDWDFIVDLGREPIIPHHYRDVKEVAEESAEVLKYDRWEGQDYYVEVWVEKQALQSVLEPICRRLHVPIVVNKGYSSASAMYQAAQRIQEANRKPVVLYFGDFDPSGEDMVRDIRDRLGEFGAELQLHKHALTLPQVEQHRCPPNPAKTTDSRYQGFADKLRVSPVYQKICKAQRLNADDVFSWELDALPVAALAQMVGAAVSAFITRPELVAVIKRREEADKKALRSAAAAIARGDFKGK